MISLSGCKPEPKITLVIAAAFVVLAGPAWGQFRGFTPNNLVVSRSVYQGTATSPITVGTTLLPPNCPQTAKCGGVNNTGVPATDSGAFPAIGSTNNVWNNDLVDGSFGITSPIFLDQMTTAGAVISTLAIDPTQIVTSFSSKSELALNLSLDGTAITFMGYIAPVNTLDVSNANTPGVVDPTNPVGENVYRAVGQVDAKGGLQITDTNAYSGNNGRAAILANGLYYAVGNDNNGTGTPPANLVNSTGVELIVPGAPPGTPQMIGSFSITQYGYAADKAGKDTNFRGLTIFNNTLYVTKGSGSNGINTVYQVGNAGSLPTAANASAAPITILPGFDTILAKAAGAENPFGICFADANTLYVADEGDGTQPDAATSPNAGLQKWVFNGTTWQRVYVLQSGLNLGVPYSVPNYPMSLNPSPDGLRNLTCRLNQDGTVSVWAVTSTVSANGDQGADPNQLVTITDMLANTDPAIAAKEQFTVLRTANYGEVLRGVAFTAGTTDQQIINYNLISSQTEGTGKSLLTYRADLVNSGPPLGAATATATSSDPFSFRVLPGQNTLNFSPVPADGQTTSKNTFTILANTTVPLNLNNLQWNFQNTPAGPVANPGPNQIVPVGSTVTLDGTGSSNPTGTGTLTYDWVFTSRPAGSVTRLFYTTSPIAMFQANTPGIYVLTLTVNDGVGSNSATVTITAQ